MKQLKMKQKKDILKKGAYLEMLLGTLGASILGNLLTGRSTIRAGEDTIIADQEF